MERHRGGGGGGGGPHRSRTNLIYCGLPGWSVPISQDTAANGSEGLTRFCRPISPLTA